MESLETIIGAVKIFQGLKPEHLALMAGCASNVRLEANTIVGRVGDTADKFWVIREGHMALELTSPGRGTITVSTMAEGDVVGFSWLLPPYHLHFDIRALSVTRALQFDARCLRGKIEGDPLLGYELLSRFSTVMAHRIQAMSFQLLDVFGDHPIEHD